MISLTPYDMTDETKIITTSPEQDCNKWRGKGVVASQTIFKQDFLTLLFFSLWSGKQIAWILLIRPSLRPAALVHFFVHPTPLPPPRPVFAERDLSPSQVYMWRNIKKLS